jgi:hypothetical protein
MLDLHMADRAAPFDALLPRVAVRRSATTLAHCPALNGRVAALLKTSIAIPRQDVVMLHPTLHRLIIQLQSTTIDATLVDDDSAMVRWAVETFDALQACTSGDAR